MNNQLDDFEEYYSGVSHPHYYPSTLEQVQDDFNELEDSFKKKKKRAKIFEEDAAIAQVDPKWALSPSRKTNEYDQNGQNGSENQIVNRSKTAWETHDWLLEQPQDGERLEGFYQTPPRKQTPAQILHKQRDRLFMPLSFNVEVNGFLNSKEVLSWKFSLGTRNHEVNLMITPFLVELLVNGKLAKSFRA